MEKTYETQHEAQHETRNKQSDSRTVVYTLRIDAETYEHIKSTSEKENIPIAYIIRRSIRRGLGLPIRAKEQERIVSEWE